MPIKTLLTSNVCEHGLAVNVACLRVKGVNRDAKRKRVLWVRRRILEANMNRVDKDLQVTNDGRDCALMIDMILITILLFCVFRCASKTNVVRSVPNEDRNRFSTNLHKGFVRGTRLLGRSRQLVERCQSLALLDESLFGVVVVGVVRVTARRGRIDDGEHV